jgi:hypothetical protein
MADNESPSYHRTLVTRGARQQRPELVSGRVRRCRRRLRQGRQPIVTIVPSPAGDHGGARISAGALWQLQCSRAPMLLREPRATPRIARSPPRRNDDVVCPEVCHRWKAECSTLWIMCRSATRTTRSGLLGSLSCPRHPFGHGQPSPGGADRDGRGARLHSVRTPVSASSPR